MSPIEHLREHAETMLRRPRGYSPATLRLARFTLKMIETRDMYDSASPLEVRWVAGVIDEVAEKAMKEGS